MRFPSAQCVGGGTHYAIKHEPAARYCTRSILLDLSCSRGGGMMTEMTTQEALAILHQVYNAYVDLVIQAPGAQGFRASEPVRQQGILALFRLSDEVHGPRQPGELHTLCDGCHLRRARREI